MSVLIGAVCVAYHPDVVLFDKVISSALAEVDFFVIVNNGKNDLTFMSDKYDESIGSEVFVVDNNDNLGIAHGLNIGIKFLTNKNCKYFLLLDQDSVTSKGLVACLFNSFEYLESHSIKVAAIGPAFFNPNLGEISPHVRFKKTIGFEKVYNNDIQKLLPVHTLITSGSLISQKALRDIGLMDDGLFIDYVDIEWCLRALSKGYSLYANTEIVIQHSLGDDAVVFFGKKIFGHPPIRHYYMARNLIHLMRRSYIPFNWKLTLFLGMAKVLSFYSLIPVDRMQQFKMIIFGFYHGFIGRLGRIDKSFSCHKL